jgi:hypothetical protein
MRPICNTRKPPSIGWPLCRSPGAAGELIAKLGPGFTGYPQKRMSQPGSSLAEPCRQAGPVLSTLQ